MKNPHIRDVVAEPCTPTPQYIYLYIYIHGGGRVPSSRASEPQNLQKEKEPKRKISLIGYADR